MARPRYPSFIKIYSFLKPKFRASDDVHIREDHTVFIFACLTTSLKLDQRSLDCLLWYRVHIWYQIKFNPWGVICPSQLLNSDVCDAMLQKQPKFPWDNVAALRPASVVGDIRSDSRGGRGC